MDVSGTQLLDSLSNLLAGSQYGNVGNEFAAVFGSVCAARSLEPFTGRLQEMEYIIKGLQSHTEIQQQTDIIERFNQHLEYKRFDGWN